jgi:glycosyltransferase involved in cell wall biosynthesis
MLSRKFFRSRDILWTASTALFDKLLHSGRSGYKPSLYYIVPEANWVTDWVGRYLTREIRRNYGWKTHLTSAPEVLSGQIVHYGEMGTFLATLGKRCNQKNHITATIFHGVLHHNQFPALANQTERFLQNTHLPNQIVTACKIMCDRLLDWGIPKEKVHCIPLGIDLQRFVPPVEGDREKIRLELDIPPNSICIGSFQKDGDGWGEGLVPKLIKGPDILLEVLSRLKSHFPIVVLLSGPARGYVKQGLKKMGIPHRHVMVRHYPDIYRLYHALDLYLVTSREEGGPLAVLETQATAVPIVSAKVGLAPDLIKNDWNGLLVDVEDINGFVESTLHLLNSPGLRSQFQQNGLELIRAYDWSHIAARYYEEIYEPLLQLL